MPTKNHSKLQNNDRIRLMKWVSFQFLSENWQRWGRCNVIRETVPVLFGPTEANERVCYVLQASVQVCRHNHFEIDCCYFLSSLQLPFQHITSPPLASAKLYCLVTDSHVCKQVNQVKWNCPESNPRPVDCKCDTAFITNYNHHINCHNKTAEQWTIM